MASKECEENTVRLSKGPDGRSGRRQSKLAVPGSERDKFLELIHDISSDLDVTVLSCKILSNVAILTSADRCSLFLVKGTGKNRALVTQLFDVRKTSIVPELHNQTEVRIPWGKGIIGQVAMSGESVIIPNAYECEHFNQEVDQATGYKTKAIMCLPIKNAEGEVIGVAQAINKVGAEEFTSADENVFRTYLTFCGLSITKAQLFERSASRLRKNEGLVRMARGIFEQHLHMKDVVHRILVEGIELIHCELCSVMIVEESDSTGEIHFSHVFELSQEQRTKGELSSDEKQPGVLTGPYLAKAKTVATSGKLMNLSTFDEKSKHSLVLKPGEQPHLETYLCLPIYDEDQEIIGVMQFVNKELGLHFDEEDENMCEGFAVFCGLGIHKVMLYDNMVKAVARRNIALEVLSYHALSTTKEVARFDGLSVPAYYEFPDNLTAFSLDDMSLSEDETVLATVRMFQDANVTNYFRINHTTLIGWILSVKKNYRSVTYHNWRHAFNVFQCMFAMFTSGQLMDKMSPMEKMTLLIASLCHDLDHRGTTNTFQTKSSSPLADLYTTSTMEHHHFDHSILILNSEGNNIMENMDSGEYTTAIKMLESAILATDLALYFRKKSAFVSLIEEETFDWDKDSHRQLICCMMMTACDLSAITKPWPIQERVAHLVASEFFEQGDIERSCLKTKPVPMMDREKKDEIPKMQVGFIDAICLPLYQHFAELWPPLTPLLKGVQLNRQKWQALADKRQSKKTTEEDAHGSSDGLTKKQLEGKHSTQDSTTGEQVKSHHKKKRPRSGVCNFM